MPLTEDEQKNIFECILKTYSGPINPFRDDLVNALLRCKQDVAPEHVHEQMEECEDRGYVQAVSDIADYHRGELKKLAAALQASEVVGIPIGTVWEGKFVGPAQLREVAHYHTEMLKVIEERFMHP